MKKEIYKAITNRLTTANIGIQYISLWNQNTEQLNTQMAFRLPAVFIEFEPMTWEQLSGRAKSTDANIRLHIISETLATAQEGGVYQDRALERLDLCEKVSAVMVGLCGNGFNSFMAIESITDSDHERIIHDEECFVTHITDISATKPIPVASGVKVMISK